MTAIEAGKIAAEGFWSTIRRIRDQWILLVFLATALFWTRDLYERFVDLPKQVADLQDSIGGLRIEVAKLDARTAAPDPDRSPTLVFEDRGHGIGDGAPGRPVTARFAVIHQVRGDCQAIDLAAFMIDSTGRWFTVATGLDRLPRFSTPRELAFSVVVHPEMAEGRARFLAQITEDCGTHVQVESSPTLHFRVLPKT